MPSKHKSSLFEFEDKLVKKLERILKPIVKPIVRQECTRRLDSTPAESTVKAETQLITCVLIDWWVRSLCKCLDAGPKEVVYWSALLSKDFLLPPAFKKIFDERCRDLLQDLAGTVLKRDDEKDILRQMGKKLPRKLWLREDAYVHRLRCTDGKEVFFLKCDRFKSN